MIDKVLKVKIKGCNEVFVEGWEPGVIGMQDVSIPEAKTEAEKFINWNRHKIFNRTRSW